MVSFSIRGAWVGMHSLRILHDGYRILGEGVDVWPGDYHDFLVLWFALLNPTPQTLFSFVSVVSRLTLPLIYRVFRDWSGQ